MRFVRDNPKLFFLPIFLGVSLLISPHILGQTDSVQQDSSLTDTSSYYPVIKSFTTNEIFSSRNVPKAAAKFIRKGERLMSLGPSKFEKALVEFLLAQEVSPDNSYVNFKVGQCYLKINKSKNKSVSYLQKALNQNKRVDLYIHYLLGYALHLNMDLDAAILEYEAHIELFKKKHRRYSPEELDTALADVNKRIFECNSAIKLMQKPKRVFMYNLGDKVNSEYPDYDPFLTQNDTILFFTSRRKGTRGGGRAEIDAEYYEDIYITRYVQGGWTQAESMSNRFNKRTNNAIIGVSGDGLTILLYRDIEKGNIYLSKFEKDKWSRPKNLKSINTEYHESSACFSHDNKTLYFVSDMPGGYGKGDIYKSSMDDEGNWGKAVNLGATINTEYEEGRVYIHRIGKNLYFSSKGHNSMGGYDIFNSSLDSNGVWSKPVNIGYPINTVDDDISFIVSSSKGTGYYSSIQPQGIGGRDIYMITFLDFIKPRLTDVLEAHVEAELLNRDVLSYEEKVTVDSTLFADKLLELELLEEIENIDFLKTSILGSEATVEGVKAGTVEIEDYVARLNIEATINEMELNQLRNKIVDADSSEIIRLQQELTAKESDIIQVNDELRRMGSEAFATEMDSLISRRDSLIMAKNDSILKAVEIALANDSIIAIASIADNNLETPDTAGYIDTIATNVETLAANVSNSDTSTESLDTAIYQETETNAELEVLAQLTDSTTATTESDVTEHIALQANIELDIETQVLDSILVSDQVVSDAVEPDLPASDSTLITDQSTSDVVTTNLPTSDSTLIADQAISDTVTTDLPESDSTLIEDQIITDIASTELATSDSISSETSIVEDIYNVESADILEILAEIETIDTAIAMEAETAVPEQDSSISPIAFNQTAEIEAEKIEVTTNYEKIRTLEDTASLKSSTKNVKEEIAKIEQQLLSTTLTEEILELEIILNDTKKELELIEQSLTASLLKSPDTLTELHDIKTDAEARKLSLEVDVKNSQVEIASLNEQLNNTPTDAERKSLREELVKKEKELLVLKKELIKAESIIIEDSTEVSIAKITDQETEPDSLTDLDDDGVPDAKDKCPNEAGSINNFGCPIRLYLMSKNLDTLTYTTQNLEGVFEFNNLSDKESHMFMLDAFNIEDIVELKIKYTDGNGKVHSIVAKRDDSGYFRYQYIPYTLHLVGENRDTLMTSFINKESVFVFNNLRENQNYLFALDLSDHDLLDKVVVQYTDENGKANLIEASKGEDQVYRLTTPKTPLTEEVAVVTEKESTEPEFLFEGDDPMDNVAAAEKLEQGQNYLLKDILFDFDRASIKDESYPELERLAQLLRDNTDIKAEISGHTDHKGPARYNQLLSERRSASVVKYLISQGIGKERLIIKGYGESKPIAPNVFPDGTDNPTGREKNRRTEIKIIR